MPRRSLFYRILIWTLILCFARTDAVFAALSCSVTTSCADTTVFRMYATTNTHAETTAGAGAYTQLVCCTGINGLGNSCSTGVYAPVLKLSDTTNAHVEEGTLSNYATPVCLSVPTGGTVTIGYAANCDAYNTTIGSLSGTTNAHVGDSTSFATKICASATEASSIGISLSTDGAIPFGIVPLNTLKDSSSTGINDPQTISVDAGPATIKVQSTTFAQGINSWALAATNGANQVAWDYSINNGAAWNNITAADTYYTVESNVAQGQTRTLSFRIKMPTLSAVYSAYSTTVTILAVTP